MSTKTSVCKAKNPATCRFHGSIAQLERAMTYAAEKGDFKTYEDLRYQADSLTKQAELYEALPNPPAPKMITEEQVEQFRENLPLSKQMSPLTGSIHYYLNDERALEATNGEDILVIIEEHPNSVFVEFQLSYWEMTDEEFEEAQEILTDIAKKAWGRVPHADPDRLDVRF